MDITELLSFSVKHKASDLHLSAGVPPMIRVDGDVRKINLPTSLLISFFLASPTHIFLHFLVVKILNSQ